MPGSKASKLKNRAAAQAFLADVKARTFCAHCGAQPIEWHNPEHIERDRRHFQIGPLASGGSTIAGIESEMARCTPLCRRCHMIEDGRMRSFLANAPHVVQAPKPCVACDRPFKPLRRGLCSRCASRRFYYTKTESGENRGAVAKRAARRAPVSDLTGAQWSALKRAYRQRCAYCGLSPKSLAKDHVVPLSRGGWHSAINIVPACGSCNSRKHVGPALPVVVLPCWSDLAVIFGKMQ